ncbi:hypothetical protein RvY_01322 [Ramazzottius varieornatus]|uniref:Chitin-binding type-2 domain-containing protein n=1 Tax=Ramazzottius varieornatus TaxID=947166 RepID=A0A1D1UM01_RAMVA|nr:hypothetical protein RvY_01322 [Ramazzottius varieornatus]
MKVFLLSLCLTVCWCAPQGRYIFDLLKQPLTAAEIDIIMASRNANAYPTYDVNNLPTTTFTCTQQDQPGYYADVETQCQVFHRCDVQGNLTTYICVNTTVFNQLTLVCDYWYNVDCVSSKEFSNFANSRLYTDQQLFDTPPAGYVITSTSGNSAPIQPAANRIKFTPVKANQVPAIRTIPIQVPVVNLTSSGRSDAPAEAVEPVAVVPVETAQPAGTRFVVVRTA